MTGNENKKSSLAATRFAPKTVANRVAAAQARSHVKYFRA